MKQVYSDYVAAAMRTYIQHPTKPGEHFTQAQVDSWNACDKVVKQSDPKEREIIIAFYGAVGVKYDELAKTLAADYETTYNAVWDLINLTQRQIAKERGLI